MISAPAREARVRNVVDVTISQLPPDQVIAMLSIEIEDSLCVPEIERLIHGIEDRLRSQARERLRSRRCRLLSRNPRCPSGDRRP
jgi:hypothetical protein